MTSLVQFLAICVYFSVMEALLYHLVNFQRLKDFNAKKDIGEVFTLLRIATYFTIMGLTKSALIFCLPAALMFPFIHDGTYYACRNLFDRQMYRDRFFSNPSKHSMARMTLPFSERLIFFLIGLIGSILLNNYYLCG